jgi:hypothetical protein
MPKIDYDSGTYFIRSPIDVVKTTQVKPDIQVVIVRHGPTYYVSRVFEDSEGGRFPQHWNECASLLNATSSHDVLVKTS